MLYYVVWFDPCDGPLRTETSRNIQGGTVIYNHPSNNFVHFVGLCLELVMDNARNEQYKSKFKLRFRKNS